MISFIVPTEERGFHLSAVSTRSDGLNYPRANANGNILNNNSISHRGGRTSPNNNNTLSTTFTSELDNGRWRRRGGAQRHISLIADLPMVDDSSSSEDSTLSSQEPLQPQGRPPDPQLTSPVSQTSTLTSPVSQTASLTSPVSQTSTLTSPVSQTSTLTSPVSQTSTLTSPVSQTSTLTSPVSETVVTSCCRRQQRSGNNRTRSGKLKRVSFGSSKGSMVETLIYDCEPEDDQWRQRRPGGRHAACFDTATPSTSHLRPAATHSRTVPPQHRWSAEAAAPAAPSSRVRVTYFESRRPLSVSGSEEGTSDVTAATSDVTARVTARTADMPTTQVVSSVDGWENPFRPGGELSREADQIVRAIQTGQPLLSSDDRPDGVANGGPTTNGSVPTAPAEVNGSAVTAASVAPLQAAPPAAAGHSAPPEGATVVAAQQPGTVEVRHSVVAPQQPGQVERVAIKRKHSARCCTIQ